jgi:hypothetical protein
MAATTCTGNSIKTQLHKFEQSCATGARQIAHGSAPTKIAFRQSPPIHTTTKIAIIHTTTKIAFRQFCAVPAADLG